MTEDYKARESALWRCLAKLIIYVPIPRGQRRKGHGGRQIDTSNAIIAHDFPALCAALGVEVCDE
jgi:hypothetical protein